ncbi:unnamed protein product [Urochloa humidicola]
MCLAVIIFDGPRYKLQLWVMAPPDELGDKDKDRLYWDLRYCFDLGDGPFYVNKPWCTWLDHDQMLCYRHAELLYKCDTRQYSSSSNAGPLLFDQQVQLPEAPSASPSSSHSDWLPSCRWNICGGYYPSLLSPLTFVLPPSQEENGKKRQFEHSLLRALTQHK